MTRKQSVLIRVSSLAIAAALTANAAAQSFLGDPTVTFGTVNITEGTGTTDLDVSSSTAVIDWTPDDNLVGNFGAIAFQNAGTTATFTSASDFAVLNRINVADPSRLLFMDGAINSLVSGQTGGSIYFYSPSGFVIGSNAIINVGSLVLSASPIAVDGNGIFINGTSVNFNQAPNPNSLINTVAGSQINANGSGSYVALVAPQITHHGTIRTDTAAALVAAEAATINFSPDGLFDIQVTVGTDAATGIHVEGGTIARNSATEGANHYAYLVAVAKNDAVTMLINSGGSVGFDTATSAAVEDNVVVLSGGNDILDGGIWTASGVSSVDLNIDNAAFTTDTVANVSGAANINSASGATSFDGLLNLTSGGNTLIEALNGNGLDIAGDLFANAFSASGGSSTGQQVELRAQGGSTLSVGGDVFLSADSFGAGAADDGLNGANATGGNVIVRATNSGTITISGSLDMSADGFGGDNFFSNGAGGNGTGGLAYIQASGGGTVNITGTTFVSADGFGGSSGECSGCLITGGTGTGGQALVSAAGLAGNIINFGSDLSLSAAGFGGAGDVAGGSGLGGIADLFADDGATVTVAGDTEVDASGFGGYGFDAAGGLGLGGQAQISTGGGAATLIDLIGDVFVTADGIGGAADGAGSAGGDGTGGIAQVYAPAGSVDITASLFVAAVGDGATSFGGTGGDGLGGQTLVGSDGGTIHIGTNLFMDGGAIGGDGDTGGSATALVSDPEDELQPIAVAVVTGDGGSITVDGNTVLSAQAEGGNGANGNGGNAAAGEVDVVAYFGDITLNSLAIGVSAYGGSGGNGGSGGDAFAGVVDVAFGLADAAVGGTITLGSAFSLADGFGGAGGAAPTATPGGNGGGGGDGTGGSVLFVGSAAGGTLDSGAALITARGEGGAGGAGGNGIDGTGGAGGAGGLGEGGFIQTGTISADLAPGSGGGANYTTLSIDTSGFGGTGGDGGTGGGGDGGGGNGGDALGGLSLFLARGVLVSANTVQMFASAAGGDGGIGSVNGNGGDATTGLIRVESKDRVGHPTERGTLEVGTITGTAIAVGGTGFNNGTSTVLGGSYFRVLNGDATIGSLSFTIAGDSFDGSLFGHDLVSVRAGVATIGRFSFTTTGELALDANNGSMTADSIILSAGTFVANTFNPPPTIAGTYFADSFDITTGGDFITNAHLDAVSDLTIIAPGSIAAQNIFTDGALALSALSGSISTNDLFADTDITLDAAGSVAGAFVGAGGSISVVAGDDASFGDMSAGGDVLLDSGGSMSVGHVLAQAGSVQASAVDVLSFLSITAGTFVTIDPTAIIGGDVTALAGDVTATGDSIDIGNVSASDNVILTATAGDLSTLAIDAGLDVTLDATGDVTTGDITAGGLIDATGASLTLGNLNANSIDLTTTVADLTVGNVTIPGNLALTTAGDLIFGDLSAFDVDLAATESITGGNIDSVTDITALAGTNLSLGNLVAGGSVSITGGSLALGDIGGSQLILTSTLGDVSTGDLVAFSSLTVDSAEDFLFGSIIAPLVDLDAPGSIIGGFIDSATDIIAVAGADIDVGDLTAGGFDGEVIQPGDVSLTAGGDIATGLVTAEGAVSGDAGSGISMLDISALDFVDLSAGGSIATGNVDADSVAMVAGGNITTGDIFAFGAVSLDAFGFLSAGDITAGTIDLLAGDDVATGDLTTQIQGLVALLFPGASITLEAGGDIATGDISSVDGVYANAGGGIAAGAIDAVDFVQLLAGGDISTGDILAGSYIDIISSGGGIATGDLTGTEIDLEANGDISFGDVDADSLDFDASGAVTGGDIVAFSQVGGDAEGAIILGNITVGPGLPQVDDFSVGIASATSITVGNVSGTDRVGFATFGDLTTGNLSAADLVMTLVGGNISTGAITTQSDGIVYMAAASMFIDAGGGEDSFDASLVLALDPVPTGGSIAIGGPVSTGLFQEAAGTGLTTGSINADTIEASAGGTATLNGLWSAQDVTLASNDIDITSTGGISGSSLVTLISTNATQALIGDGLTGTGYALSNAEFGRIEGGSVYILARGDASAAIDMLIGDLTVTGPSAGSTIESSDGILVFATGDVEGETSGGVIRVVGDVAATGFGSGNAMEFHADRFELDAATGSISLTSSGGALAGELGLYADQIHVAEGSILDQLAVDPQYAGYQDDLNAPAAVQRPEGVLNASVIWIESDSLQNILIQNTGTAETPAGFLANEVFVNEDFEIAGPPGSIDLVVNGQLQTEGGTLTGIAVRDALVEGEDLSPFTDNSTINGCLLTGPCEAESPFPPGFTPTPGIQQEIVLIRNNLLPPPEFGNENFIDDNDEATEDGETSPIEPPQPLFDTSALGDKGDVDDPVSGSGNPSLMETPPPPSNQEKKP